MHYSKKAQQLSTAKRNGARSNFLKIEFGHALLRVAANR